MLFYPVDKITNNYRGKASVYAADRETVCNYYPLNPSVKNTVVLFPVQSQYFLFFVLLFTSSATAPVIPRER